MTLPAITVNRGLCHIAVNQEPKGQLPFTLAGEELLLGQGPWCGPGQKGEPENADSSLLFSTAES